MNDFDKVIDALVDVRFIDIALARKCVTRAKSNIERQYLEQSAILTIYASMEGGVRDLVAVLLNKINESGATFSDLKPCYAMLALAKICKLEQEIKDLDKQINITSTIIASVMGCPRLPSVWDMESNLTPKVLKKMCQSLDLPYLLQDPSDENDLNILLRFRNNIAHGDRRMPIGSDRLDQTSRIAVKLITSAAVNVSDVGKNRLWLTCA